ncbi:MAG: DNA ligase D [Pseudomonadota bacterium]
MAELESLKTYRAKRNFGKTPEPSGQGDVSSAEPTFVVQKHWASRLHYDFRLELDGVMKSWAVPKGPSFDPSDKRMAVQVEDHPISYNTFEGEIPANQYGAGKVIIWDKGSWQPVTDAHKGYADGNLKFELHGHKLHGKWALVRMKGRGEKQVPWLLIKEKDSFARPAGDFSVVDEMPDSVKALSDRPAPVGGEPLKENRTKTAGLPKTAATAAPASSKASKSIRGDAKPELPTGALKASLPDLVKPQLAVLVDKPPADPEGWIYEIKFDGYRLLARISENKVQLFTRNANDWTSKMPALQQALQALALPPGWYDGEVVVLGDNGIPNFQDLQQSFDTARTANLIYYVFDVPFCGGHDLRKVPLTERRALLAQLLHNANTGSVRFSQEFAASAGDVVASACQLGLEGVIGKRANSPYEARRSPNWIKLKCGQRQEFVIGGFTDPQGSRLGLGALLLGVHQDGVLVYAGSVGTGFNDRLLTDLRQQLNAIETDRSPFAPSKDLPRKPHWVKPTLLAEVSFGEWTQSGRIRHPVFHGLRDDKKAETIVRETPQAAPSTARTSAKPAEGKTVRGRAKPVAAEAGQAEPEGLLPASLRVTNPDRVIDPASGTRKIDLVRYYALVGELMMEHLKGRPVAMVRAPEGVPGELFFQKHADVKKLPGVCQLDPALYMSHPPMLEIASKEGLLSVAQWNVIEIHTQNAVASSFDKPDRMVFDLDPGEGVEWGQILEAAELMKMFLEELGLVPFLKTSGGKGLHVLVPLKKQLDWDTVKDFSEAVVAHLAQTLPQRFVLKSGPKNRVGKIFIDYLRNGLGATTVAAWSARSRPGLGISVPVDWSELKSLKGGDHWTVKIAHTRLDKGNAPWSAYAKSALGLSSAMKALGFKKPGR